jgi:hypothetical protein
LRQEKEIQVNRNHKCKKKKRKERKIPSCWSTCCRKKKNKEKSKEKKDISVDLWKDGFPPFPLQTKKKKWQTLLGDLLFWLRNQKREGRGLWEEIYYKW